MKKVTFIGYQLTARQRAQQEQRKRLQQYDKQWAKSFQQQVDVLCARSMPTEEDPYKFKFYKEVKGTPWLGDVFGYE